MDKPPFQVLVSPARQNASPICASPVGESGGPGRPRRAARHASTATTRRRAALHRPACVQHPAAPHGPPPGRTPRPRGLASRPGLGAGVATVVPSGGSAPTGRCLRRPGAGSHNDLAGAQRAGLEQPPSRRSARAGPESRPLRAAEGAARMQIALIADHIGSLAPSSSAGADQATGAYPDGYPDDPAADVLALARALAGLEHEVTVYARRDAAALPESAVLVPRGHRRVPQRRPASAAGRRQAAAAHGGLRRRPGAAVAAQRSGRGTRPQLDQRHGGARCVPRHSDPGRAVIPAAGSGGGSPPQVRTAAQRLSRSAARAGPAAGRGGPQRERRAGPRRGRSQRAGPARDTAGIGQGGASRRGYRSIPPLGPAARRDGPRPRLITVAPLAEHSELAAVVQRADPGAGSGAGHRGRSGPRQAGR